MRSDSRALKKGSTPYIHTYEVRIDDIKRDLRTLCYEAIDAGAFEYVGDNLSGRFPDWCSQTNENPGETPGTLCHVCSDSSCERSAAYVRVLVSDNVLFDFDDLLKSYAVGEVEFEAVLEGMMARLDAYGFSLAMQYVFREPTGRYVKKVGDDPVPQEEVEKWSALLDSKL